MANRIWITALTAIIAMSPISAASAQPILASAPVADAGARYCLRLAPLTGSQVETVKCWTRDEWADQDVNVDKEWAKEGVGIRR